MQKFGASLKHFRERKNISLEKAAALLDWPVEEVVAQENTTPGHISYEKHEEMCCVYDTTLNEVFDHWIQSNETVPEFA